MSACGFPPVVAAKGFNPDGLYTLELNEGEQVRDLETGRISVVAAKGFEGITVERLGALSKTLDASSCACADLQESNGGGYLDVSCGVVAALLYGALYGDGQACNQILKSMPEGAQTPTSLEDVRSALGEVCGPMVAYEGDVASLFGLQGYVVAHLDSKDGGIGHFVLARGVEGDEVALLDPHRGELRITSKDLISHTSGKLRFVARDGEVRATSVTPVLLVVALAAVVAGFLYHHFRSSVVPERVQ